MNVNLHNLKSVTADSGGHSAWVTFADHYGGEVHIFCHYRLAERFAEAFADYEDWLSGQETTVDAEGIAARESRLARDLKEAGRT